MCLSPSEQGRRGERIVEDGQKEKFSDKISLIYFNQIEAFHATVRGRGGERKTFALSRKIFKGTI